MYKNALLLGGVLVVFLSVPAPLIAAREGSFWRKPISKCWTYGDGEPTTLKSASDNGKTVITPLSNGTIVALDSISGKQLWSRSVINEVNSDLEIRGRTLFLATQKLSNTSAASLNQPNEQSSTEVNSVDIDSGIVNWSKSFPTASEEKIFLLSEENSLFVANSDGFITKLRASDGSLIWELALNSSLSATPVLFGDYLLANTGNKTVVMISKNSGKISNQVVSGVLPTSSAIVNSSLVVGTENGFVKNLRLPKGSLDWQTRTGGRIRQLTPINSGVLAISDDNFVYFVAEKSGKKLWKRKLSGRILGSVILDRRFGAFLSTGSNEAIFVDLKNGKIINRILSERADYFISPPIVAGNTIILPTNNGLEAFSPKCAEGH